MSFSDIVPEEVEVETIFVQEIESSEDPPMEEWSSLPSHESIIDPPKYAAYKLGEYDPGSGEVCAKYVVTSDSSVLRHVYYAYPQVLDPGIIEALTFPEPKRVYEDNGQDLYLDLCDEMDLMPVRKFHRSLVEKEINLKYYGVSPAAIRAMSMSLAYNKTVKRLDLTSNFLTNDACYHLGLLLNDNQVLDELILAQCRIGASGILRLTPYLGHRTMEVLDVSSNELEDEGFQHLANVFARGGVIKRLNLSNNSLGAKSSRLLAEVIEFNNTISHLNLSWNQLYEKKSCDVLLRILSLNKCLVELDFSWNNLNIATPRLRNLVKAKNLKLLNLSHNRFGRPSARPLSKGLEKSKNLKTLDLSYNPFGPKDSFLFLQALYNEKVGLVNLIMDGVIVSKMFREELEEIKKLPFREKLTVTYERVERDYVIQNPKIRPIVLKRLDYIFARSVKKCKVDISVYFMTLYKENPERDFLMENEFLKFMKENNLKPDQDLIEQLMTLFPGPTFDKSGRTLKLSTVIEYIHRLWPEKKPPPTPPKVPERPPTPHKKPHKKPGKPKK